MHETERADMVFGFALKTQKSVNRVLNGLAKIERQFAILGLRLPTGWSKHREAMEKDLALVTDALDLLDRGYRVGDIYAYVDHSETGELSAPGQVVSTLGLGWYRDDEPAPPYSEQLVYEMEHSTETPLSETRASDADKRGVGFDSARYLRRLDVSETGEVGYAEVFRPLKKNRRCRYPTKRGLPCRGIPSSLSGNRCAQYMQRKEQRETNRLCGNYFYFLIRARDTEWVTSMLADSWKLSSLAKFDRKVFLCPPVGARVSR